jgi:nitrogen fixation protein NifB
LPELLDDLLAAGAASVSLRVHAVGAAVAKDVYAWVRPGKKTMPLAEGVGALLADQAVSARMLAERGVEFVVESACIMDVNDEHLPEVARIMAGLGASGIRLAGCTGPEVREAVAGHLDLLPVLEAQEPNIDAPDLDASRPCVAVATTDGIQVDGHLGQAKMLLVYEMSGGQVSFKEARQAPAPGTEDRWHVLAQTLSDCRAVLAAHAGESPRKALAGDGIRLLQAQGGIEGAVKQAFDGSMSKAPSCGGSPC